MNSITRLVHVFRCGCDECVVSSEQDSLRHSQSRINAYRALTSPSLIALSSRDPLLTAFELSWELRRLSRMETEFRAEYNVSHKLYIVQTDQGFCARWWLATTSRIKNIGKGKRGEIAVALEECLTITGSCRAAQLGRLAACTDGCVQSVLQTKTSAGRSNISVIWVMSHSLMYFIKEPPLAIDWETVKTSGRLYHAYCTSSKTERIMRLIIIKTVCCGQDLDTVYHFIHYRNVPFFNVVLLYVFIACNRPKLISLGKLSF